ncbi:hypothetical protein [Calothrix sp. NIES-3974]|uniref:hypothetical protein n=1 Tax=Calothrix sp. NIES-3974 TaxID=2005462 RepID=UPI000B603493|nr:hypothetical protein [Calothrix sp. NIES-3974]BAZ03679.1 hypothetical protein NIES3974_03080 [Calothrix sp. NIES-3974]
MNSNQKKNFGLLPRIESISDAQKVGRQGTWAACFVAGMTTLLVLGSIFAPLPLGIPVNVWSLIDAVIMGIIAWRIYRMSRVAALAGLIYYIIGQISMFSASEGKYKVGFVTILITLAFVNSVRGTFAYHRLQKTEHSESYSEIDV